MISAITLENFRGFKNYTRVPLSKLNLFFGPNSSGKSTVSFALAYLHMLMERMDANYQYVMQGGKMVSFGGFTELLYN